MKRIIAALITALFAATAQAQDARSPEIEDVISNQMAAFLDEDVATAFSYAGPGIQSMFGSAENFGLMVQRGYPMVWSPADVRFGALRDEDGQLRQRVYVTDAEGKMHALDYEMLDLGGQWRIGGVTLAEMPDLAA